MRVLIYTFLLILLFHIQSYGQNPLNFVPNPGFELGSFTNPTCVYDNKDMVGISNWQNGLPGNSETPHWSSYAVNVTCSNYPCSSNPFAEDKFIGIEKSQQAPIGKAILTELITAPTYGKKYKLRVIASGNRPQDFFSVHLSKYSDSRWTDVSHPTNQRDIMTATIPFEGGLGYCMAHSFESIVTANKNELYFIILSTTGGLDGNCFFWIDRVELYEYCTENLYRHGRLYKYKTELEEANFITAGSVIGTTNLGEVRMLNGSLTTYKANTQVSLVQGFYVERGGDFTAKIGKCGSDCAGTDIPIPIEYVICDNQCITLDGGTRRGMTYEWRAVNPEHIAYLTETNTPNPVFCPPSTTTYGTYAYTVTVKNACGDSTTKTVYIHYDVNSNPNPNFQIISSNLADLPDNPSLTIRTELHTEYISVEVLDCDDNVLRSTIYKGGIDFVAGNIINWTMNEFSNPCECYKIRVRSKNYCYEEIKEEIFQWGRKRTPNNILLPTTAFCRDGKRWICIDASGTTSIDVQIFNRWGSVPIMTKTYAFTSNPYCFEIPNGNVFATGTYFMIVKFKGCDGSTYTSDRTTIFLPNCGDNLISDSSSNFTQIGDGDGFYSDIRYFNSETGLYDSLYTTVSPNPMTDAAVINYHIPKAGNVKVSVLNANFETRFTLFAGENVPVGDYSLQLNTAPLLTGTNYYMIELNNEKNAKVIKRISVIK